MRKVRRYTINDFGPGGSSICLETENTQRLSERFDITRLEIRKFILPNSLETIESEDLAARLLVYSQENTNIVAVSKHDFIADIYDELTADINGEKKRFLETEHSLTTDIKNALKQLFLNRFSLIPPPPAPVEEHIVSPLIAMARVNPNAIAGETTNMISDGYFNQVNVIKEEYLEPTEKLLDRVFKAQGK